MSERYIKDNQKIKCNTTFLNLELAISWLAVKQHVRRHIINA